MTGAELEILVVALLASATSIALIKPKLLYYAAIFFIGWFSVFVDIGVTMTLSRLLVIILLLALPGYLGLRKKAVRLPLSVKPLLIFIGYAVSISLLAYFFSPQSYIKGFTRGEGRGLFQIAGFFISIAPAFLPLVLLKTVEDLKKCAKVFIASTVTLCILGWVQLFVLYLYHVNLFPIFRRGLLGSATQPNATGVFWAFGATFYRMNSLGGEPRYLGMTIVTAIFILLAVRLSVPKPKEPRFVSKTNLLLMFLLVSLAMTYAGSGFLLLLAGLAVISVLPFFIKGLRSVFSIKLIVGLVVITLLCGTIITSSGALSWGQIGGILWERTFARSPIEDFDAAILGFLSAHPQYGVFGVGLGNIHLYARDYLPKYAMSYAYNAVFVAKSGYLRIISELGIVGLILLSWAYLVPLWQGWKYLSYIQSPSLKRIMVSSGIFAVLVFIGFLLRGYLMDYMYIALGFLYFLNQRAKSVIGRQYE